MLSVQRADMPPAMIIHPVCKRRPSLLSLGQPDYADADSSHPSPIQRVPPEILGIIFCHALPTTSDFVEPSIRTAPLLLGRVCKYWRELAERTPELWASISLFLLRPYERATRAFEQWILRSGSCPLRIKLVVMTNSYLYTLSDARTGRWLNGHRDGQRNPLKEFIHNLALQSYRWLVADIAVPGCFMQSLLAHEAPMLRKLTLSDPLAESGGSSSNSVNGDMAYTWEHTFALTAAPSLEQLVLKQRLRILPCTPTHPITSVQFDAFSASQIVELFNGCPMLEELGVTIKREILLLGGPETWTFPRLNTLRVSLHCSSTRVEVGASAILDRLRLPALRSLTIDGLRQAHVLHLVNLLDRTEGGLHHLMLLNISTTHNDMFEFLHRTPLLRSLRLVDSHGFDHRCLRRLSWLPGLQPTVCPHLQELWLLRSECQALATDVVENFVVSRSPAIGFVVCARHHGHHGANARGGGGVDSSSSYAEPKDPVPLKEFRFDGSKFQHEDLLARERIKAAIENGLIWKR